MFGRNATSEGSARQQRAKIVHELIRTLGRLPSTSVNAAYQAVISAESAILYPELAHHCSNWAGGVANASLVDAPILASRLEQVRQWLNGKPVYLFSLVVGLAQDKGEDRAWAMAYG
jgi:hypothetical protein